MLLTTVAKKVYVTLRQRYLLNSRVDRLITRAERAHTPFVGPAGLELGKRHSLAVGLYLAPFVDILARLRATGKHIARSTDDSIPREVYLA